MSILVRGLISENRWILFSLRSLTKKFRVNSSFVRVQGGFDDFVND
jgi:hypothetical protein